MVERFDLDEGGFLGERGRMEPSADGDYVRHSDYADLERQIAELRAELDKAIRYGDDQRYRASNAEAENARLTEAMEPSADTKASYSGEFYEHIEVQNPNFDEDSEDDEPEILVRPVLISWTSIKEIMGAIRARAALSGSGAHPALPLKEEVEREIRKAHDETMSGVGAALLDKSVDGRIKANWLGGKANGLATALDILSRLRAGEQEGKAPGAEEAFAALDVADRLIERAYGTETPQEWHDEYHNVAKARSLSEGGSRNG